MPTSLSCGGRDIRWKVVEINLLFRNVRMSEICFRGWWDVEIEEQTFGGAEQWSMSTCKVSQYDVNVVLFHKANA